MTGRLLYKGVEINNIFLIGNDVTLSKYKFASPSDNFAKNISFGLKLNSNSQDISELASARYTDFINANFEVSSNFNVLANVNFKPKSISAVGWGAGGGLGGDGGSRANYTGGLGGNGGDGGYFAIAKYPLLANSTVNVKVGTPGTWGNGGTSIAVFANTKSFVTALQQPILTHVYPFKSINSFGWAGGNGREPSYYENFGNVWEDVGIGAAEKVGGGVLDAIEDVGNQLANDANYVGIQLNPPTTNPIDNTPPANNSPPINNSPPEERRDARPVTGATHATPGNNGVTGNETCVYVDGIQIVCGYGGQGGSGGLNGNGNNNGNVGVYGSTGNVYYIQGFDQANNCTFNQYTNGNTSGKGGKNFTYSINGQTSIRTENARGGFVRIYFHYN
jgi:hypothetical protein